MIQARCLLIEEFAGRCDSHDQVQEASVQALLAQNDLT